MTTVSRDATSLVYMPATPAEAVAFVAGTGVAAPNSIWPFADTSGAYLDVGGASVDLSSTSNHAAPLAGWTRKALFFADGGGESAVNVVAAALPDLHSSSMLVMLYQALTGGNPAGSRSQFNVGPGNAETNNVEVLLTTAHKLQLKSNGVTATAATDHGTAAEDHWLRYNQTATTTDLFAGTEKISVAFSRPAAASKGIWIGQVYVSAPLEYNLLGLGWYGANAEVTDAQITALRARFVTGAVVSIAVTPVSPALTTLSATQQMTAIATFQDGSTQDVSSNTNTVWTSTSPGVATVSATGLVTSVAFGATTVTAAFGGITSAADTVVVASGVTIGPQLGAQIGPRIGPRIGP